MVSAYLASKLGKIARQIFSPWPNAAVGAAPKAALIERICDDAVAAPKLGRPFERPAMLIHAVGRDDDEFGPTVRQPATHPHFHSIVGAEALAVEPGRVGLGPPRNFQGDAGLQR